MNVEEILRKKGTRVVTVRVQETIEVAAAVLKRENIGALAVKDVVRTEGNTVIGVLSERDIVHGLLKHGTKVLQLQVSQLMSTSPITVGLRDNLADVLELMVKNRIRHVPVVEEGSLRGVISALDLMQLQLDQLREGEAVPGPEHAP
jgi:CBS domain-containing protein